MAFQNVKFQRVSTIESEEDPENDQQQRLTMRPSGMKRIFFGLLLAFGVVAIYIFWNQQEQSNPLPVEISHLAVHEVRRPPVISYSKTNPTWTWACASQRCERRLAQKGAKKISLTACNMLCGSTQFWPQPTGPIVLSSKAVTISYHQIVFLTKLPGVLGQLLEQAYSSFRDSVESLVREDLSTRHSDVDRLAISVEIKRPEELKLKLNTDESYNLTVRLNKTSLAANITAGTFFGARHALETLSQLIWWDNDEGEEAESGGTLKIVSGATVQDAPAFPYRGLLLDTSRNFFPLEYIKKTLNGMAANKLNTFHWHIADSQSFPFQSPSVPELSQYGAYGPDMVYTADDVKEVVSLAATKGIRVIIEVDSPAHAGNGWTWGPGKGLGDLAVCVNEQPWSVYCGEPPCGQLNPQNLHTYEILEKLYGDILDLTNEREFFHIGGDEVNLECWAHTLNMANYTDLHDAWGDFTLKAIQALAKANGGKHPTHVVVWSSNLSKKPFVTKYLDKEKVVVQVWGPILWPDTADLLADGYRVIMSHVDAWYLDCGFGRWREMGGAACDPYRPWQTVYNHRPWQQPHSKVNKKQILGAEACLWTEQVGPESLDGRLWPRLSAFAERLWTDPRVEEYNPPIAEEVYTRLDSQRERMVRRGFGAEAMWPQWCSQNPGMCL